MSSMSFDAFNSIVRLQARNQMARQTIYDYAAGHAFLDAFIGSCGSIVPGVGPFAIAGSIGLQVPIYQNLVKELGRIYCAPPEQIATGIVIEHTVYGGAAMLAAEFSLEFMKEIAKSIVWENGLGALATMIPVAGIVAGGMLDAAVAATMTWRVGTMASIYYQNGHHWVKNRKNTYGIAKRFTGGVSITNSGRVDLDTIPERVPEVCESQVEMAMGMLRMLRKSHPDATEQFLRETMTAEGFPPAPIEEALRRTRRAAS